MNKMDEFLFELYKDKPIYGARRLKKEIKEFYNYNASSDLYARIVNYQIGKYGEMIALGCEISYVKNAAQKSFRTRRRDKDNSYYASQLKQLERRTQK